MTKSEGILIGCGILGCAVIIGFNALQAPPLEPSGEETVSAPASASSEAASENREQTVSRLSSELFEEEEAGSPSHNTSKQ